MSAEPTRSPFAGRRWAGNVATQAHPAPEVPCRDARPEEIPPPAARFKAKAEAVGWVVRATYARGTTVGLKPRIVDSLALRMRRGDQGAVAVWQDGRFSAGFRRDPGEHPRVSKCRPLEEWMGL